MKSFYLLAITILATAVITAHRWVSYAGEIAGMGGMAAGVSRTGAKSGQAVTVDSYGIAPIEAGDVVAIGDLVMSDADGKAVKHQPPQIKSAVLTGGAAGDLAVTGMTADSTLISVIQIFKTTAKGVTNIVDLTSEFTAKNGKINNAGETGTGGHQVLVTWQTPANHALAIATQAATKSGDLIAVKLIS